jgi:serine/threonine-protein kinase
MQRVVAGDVPLPSSVEPQVPQQLESICMRALALNKNDRYPSAAALESDIEAFMTELGERASAREVGKHTADLFADTRSRMKLIVDTQLKVLQESTDSLSLIPIVSPQQGTATETASMFPSPAARGIRGGWKRAATWVAGGTFFLVVVLLSFLSGRLTARPDTRGAISASTSPPDRAQAAPPPSTTEVAAETNANCSPPDRMRLVIDTRPRSATVAIDDATIAGDRRQLEVPRDNVLHRIWVAAPGFRPKAEWVRFDGAELAVNIVLDPRAVWAAPAVSRSTRQQRDESSGREAMRRSSGAAIPLATETSPAAPAP